MSNQSRTLYQGFIMRGMKKEDAFFAVLDHFNSLHFYDRDHLFEENKKLKERVAALETKGQVE